MKRHILALFPPEFHKNSVHFQALGLAFVYVTLALTQLFTFEDFADVTRGYGLPGGEVIALVVMFLLPGVEIAALPYLLSMRLPRRAYDISRVSVLVVAGLWLVIALWTNMTGNNQSSFGIFGATLYTPNQWWAIVFVGLLTWSAWLMYVAKPAHRMRAAKSV